MNDDKPKSKVSPRGRKNAERLRTTTGNLKDKIAALEERLGAEQQEHLATKAALERSEKTVLDAQRALKMGGTHERLLMLVSEVLFAEIDPNAVELT